jgi:hypothetical protein
MRGLAMYVAISHARVTGTPIRGEMKVTFITGRS